MEQNLESKSDIKVKILNFYRLHKIKIFILIIICFILTISILIINHFDKKKNILIAEKYVQAGLQLSANKKENAKNLYEEIILSRNKFYSILSLNTIIENNLINNEEKVLNYFELLEDFNFSKENKDLIVFKKALYLIKSSKKNEGKKLLNDLIKDNSKLKTLAEEVIQY